MIIKLERAVPDDWNDYLFIYKQEHLNLIYTWEGSEQRSKSLRSNDWYFGDEQDPQYTREDFLREMFSPCHYKFMIKLYEDKKSKHGAIIGYLELEMARNCTYRIIDWAMCQQDYKNLVWETLLKEKLPRCKKFSIYMNGDTPTVEWLQSLGFVKLKTAEYGTFKLKR